MQRRHEDFLRLFFSFVSLFLPQSLLPLNCATWALYRSDARGRNDDRRVGQYNLFIKIDVRHCSHEDVATDVYKT